MLLLRLLSCTDTLIGSLYRESKLFIFSGGGVILTSRFFLLLLLRLITLSMVSVNEDGVIRTRRTGGDRFIQNGLCLAVEDLL